jgi:hypothetical protein
MEFFRVPNPNYSGEAFEEGTNRTAVVSKDLGVSAVWAALKSSGLYKASAFLFDKTQWRDQPACEAWVVNNKREFASTGAPETHLAFGDVRFVQRSTDTHPTDAELDIINEKYALTSLEPEQVYVREMLLTNDQWGKHHVRLSRGFQKTIVASMPGKSLLLGHPEARGVPAIPEGRFFSAHEWRDPEGVTWNRCKFYMVRTDQNEHARAQLDGGVWQHTSVGMETDWKQCSVCGNNVMDASKCRHVPGERYGLMEVKDLDLSPEADPEDPSRVFCGVTYRGKGTAVEGSIVYWPELNETRVLSYQTATALGDYGRAKRLLLGGDGDPEACAGRYLWVPDTGLTAACGQSGIEGQDAHQNEEDETMPETETEALETSESADGEQVAALEAQIADLTAKHETLASALEVVTASEKALREVRVAEVVRLAALLKREPDLDTFREAFGADLASMPTDKLLALETGWAVAVDETLPGGRQSTDTERDPKTGEDLAAKKPADEPRKSVKVTRLSGL